MFDEEFIDLDLEFLSPKHESVHESNKLIPPVNTMALRSKSYDNKRFLDGFTQIIECDTFKTRKINILNS